MGIIFSEIENLHVEARLQSIVIYTDWGEQRVEFEARKLHDLIMLLTQVHKMYSADGFRQ